MLELRAVRKLRPGGKCPILLFVGPPGVGKTSLGRSIARAVHRDFVWQNLGGVRDEAEIRGHRRTYVGAMLGRIIEGIRRAGSRNGAVAFEDRALREIVAAGRARPASASSSASSARSAAPSPCAPRSTRARERRVTIRPDDLAGVLGPPRHWNEVALRRSTSGVATGLAWTHTGGDIQFVEATRMPGGGKLTLTGQIGEVMRESAQAALSLARSRAQELGIAPDAFKKWDLHVHMPGGSIPKDGPSAGITLFVALVSLLTGRRVRRDVAMTGEITLRGLVLRCAGSRRCWRRPRRSRA